jgi:1,4-dihydroxy-2-naphthoate polyprenyltransferase
MNLKSFLKLVEIQTKLASLIPFLLGTVYASYRFGRFEVSNFILMFISLLCFDMVTTTLNNYFDFKRASKKSGFNYENHNAIVRDSLSERTVLTVVSILLGIAILFGILLVFNTNIVVLVVGVVSFGIGVCYSFGPVPISRTPFGEALSGFIMGFVIIFLSIYIHVYDMGIVSLIYFNNTLSVDLNIIELIYIFLLSIPTVCGIANIMLANNLCDIEDDTENERFTLPICIGKENALKLFNGLYILAFVDLTIILILHILPAISLLAFLTLIPIYKNAKLFFKKQTKKDTFALSVKNFVLISGVQAFLLGIAVITGLFKK